MIYKKTSGGATNLKSLTDVDVTTILPADTNVLAYDNASSKWIPKAAAAGAASAVNRYNMHFGYNIQNGLANYRTALANASTTLVPIHCVGDSVTHGEYTSNEPNKSWAGRLRTLLQTRYGDAGEGFINANEGSLAAGAVKRWTYGAGWAVTRTAGFGLSVVSSNANTSATTVTFTGTEVDLLYVKNSGGTANVLIDGVSVGTIDCSGASNYANKVTYTGLTNASHTMTITPATTSNVFVQGIVARKANSGIQINRMAVSGTMASDWNTANTKAAWGLYSPKLAIIAFGFNESLSSVSVATFKTNVAALIQQFKSQGSDVLLLAYHKPADGWTMKWADYISALYSLADTYNVGLVDVYQAWGQNYDFHQALGFMAGTSNDYTGNSGTNMCHPSDKGHKAIGDLIEPHLILNQ